MITITLNANSLQLEDGNQIRFFPKQGLSVKYNSATDQFVIKHLGKEVADALSVNVAITGTTTGTQKFQTVQSWVNTGGGGGGPISWGGIGGNLPDQTDLQSALDLALPKAGGNISGTINQLVGTYRYHYNLGDGTGANWERFKQGWTSGMYYLTTEKSGIGQDRTIFLHVNTQGLVVTDSAAALAGGVKVIANPKSTATSIFGVTGVLNGSNTYQNGAVIAPYIQQSGSAGVSVLKVSPFLSGVGATTLLLDVGTNTGADNSGTHNSLVSVNSSGLTGWLTTLPTHTITLGLLSTGIAAYNNSSGMDNGVANWERVRYYWASDVYNIFFDKNGTGQERALSIGNSTVNTSYLAGGGYKILHNFGGTGIIGAAGIVSLQGTLQSSTGITQNVFGLTPIIAQSSGAGYNIFYISPYEQSVGTGPKLLINAGTNSNANGSGTHTSKFSVDSTGLTTLLGVQSLADGTGGLGQQTRSFANAYVIAANVEFIRERYSNSSLEFRQFSNAVAGKMFGSGRWFFGPNPVDNGYIVEVNGTAKLGGNTDVIGNLTANNVTTGGSFTGTKLSLSSGNPGGAMSITIGSKINVPSYTHIDATTAASGTVAHGATAVILPTVITASNTGVAYTNAATVYIGGSPVASTNVSIGTSWALYVNIGNSYFGGFTRIVGDINVNAGASIFGSGSAEASALVTFNSTTKGVIFPRMNTSQKNAIGTPAAGLLVYDTNLNQYQYYSGGWNALGGGGVSLSATNPWTGVNSWSNYVEYIDGATKTRIKHKLNNTTKGDLQIGVNANGGSIVICSQAGFDAQPDLGTENNGNISLKIHQGPGGILTRIDHSGVSLYQSGYQGIEVGDNYGTINLYGQTGIQFSNSKSRTVKWGDIKEPTGNWIIKTGSGTYTDDTINKLQVDGSVKSTQFRLSALNTAPATATSTGTLGEIRFTSTGIFICTATDTWVKATVATF